MKSILLAAVGVLSLFSESVQASPFGDVSWPTTSCTFKNIRVRKEWNALSKSDRKDYTDAVKCLRSKPSKLNQANPAKYPGVKTRYDDFVATHINYTTTIHLNGIFLSWHRNFVWQYETALQDECGYDGAQPYWDWPKYVGKLEKSALFDGSEYSMSGNGKPEGSDPYFIGPNVAFPHGTGGGCVTTGPFANSQINLGPFDFTVIFTNPGQLPPNAFAYNPRCLTRDINDYVLGRLCNQTAVDYLLSQKTIADFQNVYSAPPGPTYEIGAHPGGHLALGSVMLDFFSSPNEPMFFLHHAMVDKVWLDWQLRDPLRRVYGDNAVAGGSTVANIPPSPNVTLNSVESFGILDSDRKISELMAPLAGPFCYVYA